MKILTMYQDIGSGGFFDRYIRLLKAMLKEGWEVHYISTERFPIQHKNLHFHRVRKTKVKGPLFLRFLPQAMLKSLYLAKTKRFDRMVVFGSAYGFIGWFLKKFHKIPLITFVRADFLENLRLQGRARLIRPAKTIQGKSFRASDRIIVNATTLKEMIAKRYGIEGDRIGIIYNDIPPEFRNMTRKKRKKQICFIGVVEKRKGIDHLIEAYSRVHKKINRNLIVVGDGPLMGEMKKRAKELKLENKVKFLGWKKNVKGILSESELLIVPSLSEGFPNVIIEALGLGTPCTGSRVDGIIDALKYRELMFRPKNTKDLEDKIIFALNNYKKIKELCLKRRKDFIFNWERECLQEIRCHY